MACSKYGDFMMKYMDGTLDAFEEMNLHKHMETCETCAEDFAAYSEILEGFDAMEIVEAPADFAPAVMERIARLPAYAPAKTRRAKVIDGFVFVPFAVLVTTLFIGTVLALFGTNIAFWLYEAGFTGLASGLSPAIELTSSISANISIFFGGIGGEAGSVAVTYSAVFLLVFAVLVALQFSLSSRSASREVS